MVCMHFTQIQTIENCKVRITERVKSPCSYNSTCTVFICTMFCIDASSIDTAINSRVCYHLLTRCRQKQCRIDEKSCRNKSKHHYNGCNAVLIIAEFSNNSACKTAMCSISYLIQTACKNLTVKFTMRNDTSVTNCSNSACTRFP